MARSSRSSTTSPRSPPWAERGIFLAEAGELRGECVHETLGRPPRSSARPFARLAFRSHGPSGLRPGDGPRMGTRPAARVAVRGGREGQPLLRGRFSRRGGWEPLPDRQRWCVTLAAVRADPANDGRPGGSRGLHLGRDRGVASAGGGRPRLPEAGGLGWRSRGPVDLHEPGSVRHSVCSLHIREWQRGPVGTGRGRPGAVEAGPGVGKMRSRAFALVAATLLAGSAFLFAQESAAGGATPAPAAPSTVAPPAPAPPGLSGRRADETGPVPVPEPTEKALKYYRSGNKLWVVETLWGFAVPLVILFTGFSARIRTLALRLSGGRWFLTIAFFAILYGLVGFVIDLPLAYCTGFARPHAYGLSDQLPSKWWGDAFKGLGVGLVLSALTLWIPYLLLKKSPKRWWLYTAIAAVPLVILLQMISPVFIDPLFNKFGPMKDKALEQKILALADRAGISGGKVYEVDKSVDTKTVNAYVNGFGQTKQIVLWDTTLRKLKPEEVLFVMGHEMGHYVLGHVRQLVTLISFLILVGLSAVHLTANGLIARFRGRLGFDSLQDVASLPLLSLIFGLVFFVLTPAVFAFTRYTEHEADRFGLEIPRDSRNAATAFVKL